jgi:acyl-CoA-binding protein
MTNVVAAIVDVNKDFRTAAGRVRQMIAKKILSPEDVADLHGLFQQATVGNCNDWKFISSAATQLFDLNSKEKHSTWASLRGMTQTAAKQNYIDKVDILVLKYGVVFPDDPLRRAGSVTSVSTCSTYMP